jgi:transcriptional regulator with XRE-family HTH domain
MSTASINGKTRPRMGILVRVRRKYLGWSQVRLAREAAVSTMTVCNVESGRHVPDLSTIDRIAKVPSGCCLCCGQPLPETPKDPWED